MKDAHLSEARLRRLLEKDLGEEEKLLLLHHLAVCPGCHAAGGYILDLYQEEAFDLRFSVVEIDLARSRREAPALWAELLALPAPERLAAVSDEPRFRNWGLAERLCAEALSEAPGAPRRARELGTLAVRLAEGLREWEPMDEGSLGELRALAWGTLGNALRIEGADLRGSEAAFARSEEHWLSTEQDDSLGHRARLLGLWASLRYDQRRLSEAVDFLVEAGRASRTVEDSVRVFLNLARTLQEMDRLDEADAALGRAEALAEGSPPRLRLCIRHNAVEGLSLRGDFVAAWAALPAVQAECAASGTPLDALRLRWVEARVVAGLGRRGEALAAFRAVRQELAGHRLPYDVALLSLEVATLLVEELEPGELATLLDEALLVFESRDLERETLATLLVHLREAGRQGVRAAFVQELRRLLGIARLGRSTLSVGDPKHLPA